MDAYEFQCIDLSTVPARFKVSVPASFLKHLEFLTREAQDNCYRIKDYVHKGDDVKPWVAKQFLTPRQISITAGWALAEIENALYRKNQFFGPDASGKITEKLIRYIDMKVRPSDFELLYAHATHLAGAREREAKEKKRKIARWKLFPEVSVCKNVGSLPVSAIMSAYTLAVIDDWLALEDAERSSNTERLLEASCSFVSGIKERDYYLYSALDSKGKGNTRLKASETPSKRLAGYYRLLLELWSVDPPKSQNAAYDRFASKLDDYHIERIKADNDYPDPPSKSQVKRWWSWGTTQAKLVHLRGNAPKM